MAGAAVLASNAIGTLFSTCIGGAEQGKGVSATDLKSKRKRGPPRGGEQSQPVQALAHPPGEWWSGSSDEMEREATSRGGTERASAAAPSAPLSGSSTPMQATVGALGNATSGEFVNHALILWNDRRHQWVGSRSRHRRPPRGACISSDATYEDLLATSRPFPQPVPLREMVDFLVDVWDQEGLYD